MTHLHRHVPTLLLVALGSLERVETSALRILGARFRFRISSRPRRRRVLVRRRLPGRRVFVAGWADGADETARIPLPLSRALSPLLHDGVSHPSPLPLARSSTRLAPIATAAAESRARVLPVCLRHADFELRAVNRAMDPLAMGLGSIHTKISSTCSAPYARSKICFVRRQLCSGALA